MCGIAGIFALRAGEVPLEALHAMNAAMVHRGPDEDGVYSDALAGLAMRRLSIIGLSNGRQPIFNEDGTIGIVMNGELYNYRELKARLEQRGHRFRTDSDVEVAVHLYEDHGLDFVRELRGMFAFALYDRTRRRVVLGRDRSGKKPLYYAVHGDRLLFASEIKCLHRSGLLPKELDAAALESYCARGFVPGDRTLFRDVRKLPAGFVLIATGSGLELHRYWDLPMPAADAASFEEAAGRVRSLLEEAVRVRLMSEVPLGAFLSGGVDSSAVVGIMASVLGSPVQTFAIGFDHPDFDELQQARAVATHYGTTHHELVIRACGPDLLRQVNWHHDEPAADPAAVPTFCLARFARQHVTVALTGEGGDELFAGYRHYRMYRQLADFERRLGGVQSLGTLAERLEPRFGHLGPRRLWKALWIISLPTAERLRGLVSVFTDLELANLLAPEFRQHADDQHRHLEAALLRAHGFNGDGDHIAHSMYIDAKLQLADQLLMKVDKMTMAASLEARCPLLDQDLLEYVCALPTTMKISPAGSKLVLRHALRGLVPDEILDRPKHGFEVPIRRWLLNDLSPLVHELLLQPRAAVGRYFDPRFIASRWTQLQARNDHQLAKQLWLLLNFAVWHAEHWPEQEVPPTCN